MWPCGPCGGPWWAGHGVGGVQYWTGHDVAVWAMWWPVVAVHGVGGVQYWTGHDVAVWAMWRPVVGRSSAWRCPVGRRPDVAMWAVCKKSGTQRMPLQKCYILILSIVPDLNLHVFCAIEFKELFEAIHSKLVE